MSTGFLIRLSLGGKVALQDYRPLTSDGKGQPNSSSPHKHKVGDCTSSRLADGSPMNKPSLAVPSEWPPLETHLTTGLTVRLSSSGRIGVVDKWLPEKKMWGVKLLCSGSKKAVKEEKLEVVIPRINRGQLVHVARELRISEDTDPEDIENSDDAPVDITLEIGTHGVVVDLEDEDGSCYVEFASHPGEAINIDEEHFHHLLFYDQQVGVWAKFHQWSGPCAGPQFIRL
mmetsp:Transcript_624/g.1282  ORF Transcript_624/g.1282 Transcript_624/m.1282 type:complete len:229 (+) Transcript_624:96-782(+)